jgi:hypothetical protein
MNAPPVLQHNNAASSLRIYIECHNLLDTDVFSKSDPFCCLRLKNSTQPAFQEIGRTEVGGAADLISRWPVYWVVQLNAASVC